MYYIIHSLGARTRLCSSYIFISQQSVCYVLRAREILLLILYGENVLIGVEPNIQKNISVDDYIIVNANITLTFIRIEIFKYIVLPILIDRSDDDDDDNIIITVIIIVIIFPKTNFGVRSASSV